MAIRKVCCRPGCDDLSIEGGAHCELHEAERKEKLARRRASAKLSAVARAGVQLYATKAWKALRRSFITANPLCADCAELGLVVAAEEVDHIEPHRGDRSKFYDRMNLQSLCKPCHSRKTAREVLHGRGGI